MERTVKVCLRRLVVVLCVIISRLDHQVGDFPIVKVEELTKSEPQLLASEEEYRRVILTISRPVQFFGLECVLAPACHISMTSPVTARSSSWSIPMSHAR